MLENQRHTEKGAMNSPSFYPTPSASMFPAKSGRSSRLRRNVTNIRPFIDGIALCPVLNVGVEPAHLSRFMSCQVLRHGVADASRLEQAHCGMPQGMEADFAYIAPGRAALAFVVIDPM